MRDQHHYHDSITRLYAGESEEIKLFFSDNSLVTKGWKCYGITYQYIKLNSVLNLTILPPKNRCNVNIWPPNGGQHVKSPSL
jgi:hypothetical protein